MSESPKTKTGEDVSPAEFTKAMPEGEGAGPDAPETTEHAAQPEKSEQAEKAAKD